nr:MAG TPA: hypothetical protein [Caudoviricetes sp.]
MLKSTSVKLIYGAKAPYVPQSQSGCNSHTEHQRL